MIHKVFKKHTRLDMDYQRLVSRLGNKKMYILFDVYKKYYFSLAVIKEKEMF